MVDGGVSQFLILERDKLGYRMSLAARMFCVVERLPCGGGLVVFGFNPNYCTVEALLAVNPDSPSWQPVIRVCAEKMAEYMPCADHAAIKVAARVFADADQWSRRAATILDGLRRYGPGSWGHAELRNMGFPYLFNAEMVDG